LRFFGYGELPLVLLALLQREPLNGYELMGELGRLFGPTYVPSAGSVYPALTALEAEELIDAVGDELPKRYNVTKPGAEALEDRRHKLAEIERRTSVHLRPNSWLDAELNQFVQSVRSAQGQADPAAVKKVLVRAQRQIEDLVNKRREEPW
jgi:DNA-binding PadR family transcriptional regulator